MNARRLWYSALLLLAPALAGLAADKDAHGDPLPDGARARLGTARMRVLTYTPPVLAPDGKTLLVQSNTGLLRLNPATGAAPDKPAVQIYGQAVVVSADGKRVAIASANGATVCDLASGKAFAKIERHLPPGDAVALSATGTVLVLGGTNDGIKKEPLGVLLWDVTADKELRKLTVPQNEYAHVAVSGSGKTFATWGLFRDPQAKEPPDPNANPSRFVTFWDTATGKEQSKFRATGFVPSGVVFSPDGTLAAVAGNNSSIDIVDTKTGNSKHLLLGRSRMGRSLSFSPDGATLAASAEDGAVQRWKVADGARLSTTESPVGPLFARVRAVSAEKAIAWGMRGTAAVVWEVPSGKLISTAGGHTAIVRGVAVTPDGKHALTSSEDGTTLKWDLSTGKAAGAVTIRAPNFGFGGYVPAATFAPDVTRALLRDASGIGVHDLATGTQQYVIPTPPSFEGESSAAFSPDGSRVVVATSSFNPKKAPGRVTVWDAAAGKKLIAIELPGYGAVAAALTPDGKHVVTAGQKPAEAGNGEFVVTVWDLATGARRGEASEPGGFVPPHVATAPDNRTAAVVTGKGKLAAFDLATGKFTKAYELARRPVLAPVFSPDGKKLAIAGQIEFNPAPNAPLLVLDWPSGETKYRFTAPGGEPGVMVFSPDGKSLVTGSPDTTAIVWNVSR